MFLLFFKSFSREKFGSLKNNPYICKIKLETMTTEEFKIKYPQYSHLENDALWDKMTEVLLQLENVLIADPNREIIYHDPVSFYGGQIFMEDSSTTVWLNNKGEKVTLKDPEYFKGNPTESYRCEIINFGEL